MKKDKKIPLDKLKELHSQTDTSVLRSKKYKKENKRTNTPEKPLGRKG